MDGERDRRSEVTPMPTKKQQPDEGAQGQAGQVAAGAPPGAQGELASQSAAGEPHAVESSEQQPGRAEPMRFALDEDGALCNAAQDASEAQARITATTGFDEALVAVATFRRVARVLGEGVEAFNLASQSLHALAPGDGLEGMLAAEMVAIHELAMRSALDAAMPGQTWEGRDANVRRSTRCMNTFVKQIEALLKLRGKGSHQRVTVEHVTVNAGGQAVVGNVAPPGGDKA